MNKNIRVRICVVLIKDDKILLIKQAKYDKEYWLTPGGGMDFGESIKDVAKREIKEETNLDIELKKFLFLWESIYPDGGKHVLNLFFMGDILGGELKLGGENNLVDLKYFSFDELKDIKFYPPVIDKIIEIKNNGFNCLPEVYDPVWLP
ncbi:MAG: NUDIX hydrolase [Armatimonadota bacterium]